MAWPWSSYEEFKEYVHPVFVDRSIYRLFRSCSWFEHDEKLVGAVELAQDSIKKLRELGYEDGRAPDQPVDDNVRFLVIDLGLAGETILFYHARLTKTDWAYGFLHGKDFWPEWNRYARDKRLSRAISIFIRDAKHLLQGYDRIYSEDTDFLVSHIDLPEKLGSDFTLARDLFSVGFDSIGLLVAGRGLEGVLRAIAERKKIMLSARGDVLPAHEADFFDLIEIFYRTRWQKDKTRLIDGNLKSLLHFLRTIRNSGAHPIIAGERTVKNDRDVAKVVANVAGSLWKRGNAPRARLSAKVVQKDW